MTTFLFSKSQSFEITSRTAGMDTINMTDANGKKQGKWVVMGRHNPKAGFKMEQKMSEGLYKDNKKTGLWIDYYPNGNTKNKITFVEGRPNGPTTMYYENGNLREEGNWSNNHWVGAYKLIHENGDISEFVFDEKGKEISKKITPSKKSVTSKKK